MSGFVYFVTYPDTSWMKVGYATDPQKRLNQLRVSSPEGLDLAAAIPATRADELAMHKALEGCKRSREWFKCDLVSYEVLERAKSGATIAHLIDLAGKLDAARKADLLDLSARISSRYDPRTGLPTKELEEVLA